MFSLYSRYYSLYILYVFVILRYVFVMYPFCIRYHSLCFRNYLFIVIRYVFVIIRYVVVMYSLLLLSDIIRVTCGSFFAIRKLKKVIICSIIYSILFVTYSLLLLLLFSALLLGFLLAAACPMESGDVIICQPYFYDPQKLQHSIRIHLKF